MMAEDAGPRVEIVNGRAVVDSVKLAACCVRQHAPVMDAARKAWKACPDLRDEFRPATYRGRNGRDYDRVYLGYRALVAVFRYLENIPGRFDKVETLFQYRMRFVQAGAIPATEAVPMRKVVAEPAIPWPAWAITEGQLVNAVWDELLADGG
jgi:hypothetical protein